MDNNISRYSSTQIIYNKEYEKYFRGLSRQLNKNTPCIIHVIERGDNLDKLSLKYYGRPDYYWIIADFNSILDPFEDLTEYFTAIRIPAFNEIIYED